VVSTPEFCRHPDIFSFADATAEGLFECFPNLVFVAIAVGAVNVTVAQLKSCEDGFFDFTRR